MDKSFQGLFKYSALTEDEKYLLDFYQNKDLNAINMNDGENICSQNCEDCLVKLDFSLFTSIEKKKVALYYLEMFYENLKVLSLKYIDFTNDEIDNLFDRLNLKSIKCLTLIDCQFESHHICKLLNKYNASLEHFTLITESIINIFDSNDEIGKKHSDTILSIEPDSLIMIDKFQTISEIEAKKCIDNNKTLLIQSKKFGLCIPKNYLSTTRETVKHLNFDIYRHDWDSTVSNIAFVCETFPNIQTLEIHIHLLTPECLKKLTKLSKLEKLTIIFYHQENHFDVINNKTNKCQLCNRHFKNIKHFDSTLLDEYFIATTDELKNIKECTFKFIRGAIIPFTDKAFKNISQWINLRHFSIELYEYTVPENENSKLFLNSNITNQLLFELTECSIEVLKIWHCNIDDNGVKCFIGTNKTINSICIINCPKITKLSRNLMEDKLNIEYFIPLTKVNIFMSPKSEMSDTYYHVSSEQKGFCVIINNINFKYLRKRTGAEIDAKLLKYVFQDIGFKVFYETDLTRELTLKSLENFRNQIEKNPSEHLVFTLIISSHGEEDAVYAIDERIQVEEIFSIFNDKHCEGLIGKPKIFIINACRGKRDDDGSPIYSDGSNIMLSGDDLFSIDIRSEYLYCRDMIICYASVLGLKSYRLPESGSILGDILANALIEKVFFEDFEDILMNVSEMVSNLEISYGNKQSVSVEKRIWKKLKFVSDRKGNYFEVNIVKTPENHCDYLNNIAVNQENNRLNIEHVIFTYKKFSVEKELIGINKLIQPMNKTCDSRKIVEILKQIDAFHDENKHLMPFAWKSGEIQILLSLIKSPSNEETIHYEIVDMSFKIIFKLICVNTEYRESVRDHFPENFLMFIKNDGFSISMKFIEIFMTKDLSKKESLIFHKNLDTYRTYISNFRRLHEMISDISMSLDLIDILTIYECVYDKHIEKPTFDKLYVIISKCNIDSTYYRKRSLKQKRNLLEILENSREKELSQHWIIWVFANYCKNYSIEFYQDLYPSVLSLKSISKFFSESISCYNKSVILETLEIWEKDLDYLKLECFDCESGVSFIYFWNRDDFANSFIANYDEVGLKIYSYDLSVQEKTDILFLARTVYKDKCYIGTVGEKSGLNQMSIFENNIEYKLKNFQILKYPEFKELFWVNIIDGKIPSTCVSFDQTYCITRTIENQTHHYHFFNKNCPQNTKIFDILCYEEVLEKIVEKADKKYYISSLRDLLSKLSNEMINLMDEYIDRHSNNQYICISLYPNFFETRHSYCAEFCRTNCHHICIVNDFNWFMDGNEQKEECLLYLMLKLSGKLLRIQLFFFLIDREILIEFLKFINFQSVICLSIEGDIMTDDIVEIISSKCDFNLIHIEFKFGRNLTKIPFVITKYQNILEFGCESRILSKSPLKFAKTLKSLKMGGLQDKMWGFTERYSVKFGLNEIQRLLSNIYSSLSQLSIFGLIEFGKNINFICQNFSQLTFLHLETTEKLDISMCFESKTLKTLQIYSSHTIMNHNYTCINPLLQTIMKKCKNLRNLKIIVQQIVILSQSIVEKLNMNTMVIHGASKSQMSAESIELHERLNDEDIIGLKSMSNEFLTFLNKNQLKKLDISECRIIGNNLDDFDLRKYYNIKKLINTDKHIYGNKTKYIDEIIHSEKEYKMSSYPRGQCLFIFNIKTASEERKFELQIDFMRIKRLFIELGFEIIECIDGTAQLIADTLRECHEKCSKENDALFVYISTIATNDSIFDNNMNYIKIEDILDMFNNNNCKKLQEKPKIFFFDKHLIEVSDEISNEEIIVDFNANSRSMKETPLKMSPTWSDIIIVETEVPPHYGFSYVSGNALMTCLTDSLLTTTNCNLLDIITNTEKQVKEVSKDEILIKTTTRGWLKTFWFNYGYYFIDGKYKLMDTFFYFDTKRNDK